MKTRMLVALTMGLVLTDLSVRGEEPITLHDAVLRTRPRARVDTALRQVAAPVTELPQTAPAAALPPALPATEVCAAGPAGWRWLAGAGFYYLQPIFDSNPATFTQTTVDPGTTPGMTGTRAADFDWGFHLAPRVWVGFASDDWLIRGQYWRFDGSPKTVLAVNGPASSDTTVFLSSAGALPMLSSSAALVPGGPADVLAVQSDLALDVFDLDAGRFWLSNGWMWGCAAGLRYADLRQRYDGVLFNPGAAGFGLARVERQQSESNAFRGVGPRLAGEVRYDLSSHLGLYANTAGALLYGRSRQTASQFVRITDLDLNVTDEDFFTTAAARKKLLPYAEAELGVDCGGALGGGRWFLRTGVAAQVWWNAGSAAVSSGGAFPATPTGGAAAPLVFPGNDSNLAFFGLTCMMGLEF